MRQEERTTTAIVTGSGRGIGRETAVLLARRGVNVVFVLGLIVKSGQW